MGGRHRCSKTNDKQAARRSLPAAPGTKDGTGPSLQWEQHPAPLLHPLSSVGCCAYAATSPGKSPGNSRTRGLVRETSGNRSGRVRRSSSRVGPLFIRAPLPQLFRTPEALVASVVRPGRARNSSTGTRESPRPCRCRPRESPPRRKKPAGIHAPRSPRGGSRWRKHRAR